MVEDTRANAVEQDLGGNPADVSGLSGGNLVGQLLQGTRDIDTRHLHAVPDVQSHGGKVQYPSDPGIDERSRHVLCSMFRHRQDRDLHLVFPDVPMEFLHWKDPASSGLHSHLAGSGIEGCNYPESLVAESRVTHDGSTDVSSTNDDRIPFAIHLQDATDFSSQACDPVADSRLSELSEATEILPDLCICNADRSTQLARVDGWPPIGFMPLQLTQVETQSLDRRAGYVRRIRHANAVYHPVLAIGHPPSASQAPNGVGCSHLHFEDIRQRDGRTISFEFFPPASSKALETLRGRLGDFISLSPSFVSITYGAGGSTRERTHDLVVELQDSGQVEPIPHLTCVKQTRDEMQVILERYASSGVSNLLALRGDPPADGEGYARGDDEYPFAIDLVKHVCRFNESGLHPDPRGFGIGVAGFPEGHPETPNRLKQMGFLKEKVEAGAHWVTTQLFFDNAAFYDWCERCDLVGITVPLVAGIMPITSIKGLHRMADLAAGTNFPARLQRRICKHQDDPKAVQQVGIEWATEQCRDLLEQGTAGIHFYTLNNSDATMQIFRSLGAKDASALR